MKKIGVNINTSKDESGEILESIIEIVSKYIDKNNIYVFKDSKGLNNEKYRDLDVLIALGGDGTILRAARAVQEFEIPILGVNIGNLGFLTSVEFSEFEKAMHLLWTNAFNIEDRIMLQCSLTNSDCAEYIALNDIVVAKGTLSRIINYNIHIDNNFYTEFPADGIVIATPTGSTAYSLSTGGPIIYPTLNVITVSPICPHSLQMRSIVLDGRSKINIKFKANHESVFLTLDGQKAIEITNNDEIIVSISSKKCKLIKFDDYNYFHVLRKKIISRNKDCEGEKI